MKWNLNVSTELRELPWIHLHTHGVGFRKIICCSIYTYISHEMVYWEMNVNTKLNYFPKTSSTRGLYCWGETLACLWVVAFLCVIRTSQSMVVVPYRAGWKQTTHASDALTPAAGRSTWLPGVTCYLTNRHKLISTFWLFITYECKTLIVTWYRFNAKRS